MRFTPISVTASYRTRSGSRIGPRPRRCAWPTSSRASSLREPTRGRRFPAVQREPTAAGRGHPTDRDHRRGGQEPPGRDARCGDEIGLGYLSLERPSGTLSGGEAQRTKMIRHLGSALTDVTYVFDLGPGAGHDGCRGCSRGRRASWRPRGRRSRGSAWRRTSGVAGRSEGVASRRGNRGGGMAASRRAGQPAAKGFTMCRRPIRWPCCRSWLRSRSLPHASADATMSASSQPKA